jgi:hypothetical protein
MSHSAADVRCIDQVLPAAAVSDAQWPLCFSLGYRVAIHGSPVIPRPCPSAQASPASFSDPKASPLLLAFPSRGHGPCPAPRHVQTALWGGR